MIICEKVSYFVKITLKRIEKIIIQRYGRQGKTSNKQNCKTLKDIKYKAQSTQRRFIDFAHDPISERF